MLLPLLASRPAYPSGGRRLFDIGVVPLAEYERRFFCSSRWDHWKQAECKDEARGIACRKLPLRAEGGR